MAALGDVSIRTRTDLESNVDTFTRLARSTGLLHLSYQQLIDLTRGIADTVHIAGAATQQAKRALMDFAEGLAAGSLQGRQLRAMIMQLPTLGDAIGKSFGLAGSQLMEFLKIHPGALSPQAIVKSLMAALPELDAMIGKTQVTIGQAFLNLHTRLILYAQDMDKAFHISERVNEVLTFIGNNIDGIAKFLVVLAGIAAMNVVVHLIESLLTNFGFLFGVVNFLTGGLLRLGIAILTLPFRVLSVGISLFQALGSALSVVGSVAQGVTQFVSGLVTVVAGGLTNLVAFLSVAATEALAAVTADVITLGAGLAITGAAALVAYNAIAGLLAPLMQLTRLADPFKGMNLSLKDLPILFSAAFDTVVHDFPLVTKALSAIWDDMVNGMMNRLGNLGNEILHVLAGDPFGITGAFGHRHTALYQTDRPTNTAGTVLGLLGKEARNRFILQREVNSGMTGPGDEDVLAGTPNVVAGRDLGKVDPHAAEKFAAAQSALQNFLRQFSPYAAVLAKVDELNKLILKSTKAHVDVLGELTKAGIHATSIDDARRKMLVLVQREVLGLGNEQIKAKQDEDLLNQARAAGILVNNEYERSILKIREAQLTADPTDMLLGIEVARRAAEVFLQNRGDIAKGVVGNALEFQNGPDLAKAQIEALNAALADGTIKNEAYAHALIDVLKGQHDLQAGEQLAFLEQQETMLNKGVIAAEALKSVYDHFNEGQKVAIQIQAINDAMAKNPALVEQGTKAIRDLQIELLNTQTDALSGFQRGLLETQKTMNDFASTAATTVTTALNDLTDALTNFFQTGKFDIKTLGDDLLKNLDRLAVQQVIMAPLTNLMSSQGGGIFGQGGFLSSLFGGSTGLLGTQLGASPTNAMWVQVVPGIGGTIGGGSTGGLGDLFSSGGFFANLFNGGGGMGSTSGGILDFLSQIGSLLGFADGGSFQVGGSGGTDSVPVSFMATPGEMVHVTKGSSGGQDKGAASVMVQMHVHGVHDVDSFKRSEGQVVSGLASAIQRSMQRRG